MSVKSSVLEILSAQKDQEVAAIAVKYDALSAAVNAIADDVPADVTELQAQLDAEKSKSADLQTQLASATQLAVDAKAHLDADEVKLDQAKAALKALLDALSAVQTVA